MLKVEGYKMFRGQMKISLPYGDKIIEGDFLYKPEYGCWYGKGSSYPAGMCEIVEDYEVEGTVSRTLEE